METARYDVTAHLQQTEFTKVSYLLWDWPVWDWAIWAALWWARKKRKPPDSSAPVDGTPCTVPTCGSAPSV